MSAITRNWPLGQYILIAIQVSVWHACRAHKSRRRSYFDVQANQHSRVPTASATTACGARGCAADPPCGRYTHQPGTCFSGHHRQSAHSSICSTGSQRCCAGRRPYHLASSTVYMVAAAASWRGCIRRHCGLRFLARALPRLHGAAIGVAGGAGRPSLEFRTPWGFRHRLRRCCSSRCRRRPPGRCRRPRRRRLRASSRWFLLTGRWAPSCPCAASSPAAP